MTIQMRLFHGMGAIMAVLAIGSILCCSAHASPSANSVAPWWEDNLRWVDNSSDQEVSDMSGTVTLCGVADDPGWGTFGQKRRMSEIGDRAALFHARGMKVLTYFEGFGETIGFAAVLKKDAGGAWIQDPKTASSKLFATRWNWKHWDGDGDVRWISTAAYFNDEDIVRPWTRTNSVYGAPVPTYPDGTPALGYLGASSAPPSTADSILNARLYDACAAKNVLGQVNFKFTVLPTDPSTKQPIGRTTGLVLANVPRAPGPPDPGYTPQEWRAMKRTGYATAFDVGKDCVCPIWADYEAAATRMAVDSGSDGLWVDNWSPWDSFGANPVSEAFGEWSVAAFRDYLSSHFSATQRLSMGIGDISNFDVRLYLQARCRLMGGSPEDLRAKAWKDTRWQDDPVWRAYMIYRRKTGTDALTRLYDAIKKAAAERGKPEFLITGNDIPVFDLGWARENLDMVSTECSWNWSLTGGPRGLMPPPLGSYVPIFKLAREYSKSRFVNAWMYGPSDKVGIADVVSYQALANEGSTKAALGHTICEKGEVAALNKFIAQIDPVIRGRVAIEEVGLYYSTSSQLMEMLPGGFRDHNDQPHSFAVYGWGAALTALHIPWRAVAEWHLTDEALARLKLLIVPESQVFPAEDVATVQRWVQNGGSLIVSGRCGLRLGEAGNFDPAPGGSTLTPLLTGINLSLGGAIALGKGKVEYLPRDPGGVYYRAIAERPTLLPACADAVTKVVPTSGTFAIDAPGVAYTVGMTPYTADGKLFIDVNNTDIDMDADTIHPTADLHFDVALPRELAGAPITVRVLTPDSMPVCNVAAKGGGRAQVNIGPISRYACIVIERAGQR